MGSLYKVLVMIETKRLKQLKECAFLTGSVRWGCDKPYDEDWVVLRSDWNDIVGSNLGNFYYEDHDYGDDTKFQCFWLDYNGTKYNFLIPWKNEEFFVSFINSYSSNSCSLNISSLNFAASSK